MNVCLCHALNNLAARGTQNVKSKPYIILPLYPFAYGNIPLKRREESTVDEFFHSLPGTVTGFGCAGWMGTVSPVNHK